MIVDAYQKRIFTSLFTPKPFTVNLCMALRDASSLRKGQKSTLTLSKSDKLTFWLAMQVLSVLKGKLHAYETASYIR
jgi:hypothetical protein